MTSLKSLHHRLKSAADEYERTHQRTIAATRKEHEALQNLSLAYGAVLLSLESTAIRAIAAGEESP
ncbi:MAG: hypothetical protein IMZ62_06930 [Chloroflexi bacterium]|nr:hypothetical protein [Chloroflexota bacterium]